jgi:hypothetical protein
MDIKYKLYPYPIVSDFSFDYIDTVFESDVTAFQEGYNVKLAFTASINNEEIKLLIAEGKMEYAFHIECPQTCFRKVIRFSEEASDMLIPDKDLNGRMQICPFIIASEVIKGYTNKSFHDDYKGLTFDLESGCIIAAGRQVNIDIEKDRNDFADTPSIFCIVRNANEKEQGMVVDLYKDKITVKLAENDYYNYKSIRKSFIQPVLHSSIVIPALVYVLEEIKNISADERYEFEEYRWYRALKKALTKLDYDIDAESLSDMMVLKTAQDLINTPINQALEVLARGYEEDAE